MNNLSRRAVLGSGALSLLSLPAGTTNAAAQAEARDPWRGLKVGVASYTLRKLPLDACIEAIQRVGLPYVSIKDFHLPMNSSPDERRTVARKFRDAGITPLSCGVVTMQNSEANIRQAFEYARDAGIPTIVCSPHPDSFPILDRMVKEFDIRLAIHNHGPGDMKFPLPADAWKAAEPYDRRIGLCIDVGHTARAGDDPAAAIRKFHTRLFDIHLKDIDAKRAEGNPVEGGRGVLDQRAILQALLDVEFAHHVGFEYEKDQDDPLPGLAESVGYARGLMAGLRARRG